MSDEPLALPLYSDLREELGSLLAERGALGVLLIELKFLERIEEDYGVEAWLEVRRRIAALLEEQCGKEYRSSDRLALAELGGSRLVLFLDQKRRKASAVTNADVVAAAERQRQTTLKAIARSAFPYLKSPPSIPVGTSLALHNPLISVERVISRALAEAAERLALLKASDDLEGRHRLRDVIAAERVVTAYQPILRLEDRTMMAAEALSRGARGTGLEAANLLFGSAERNRLMVELDRLCRSRALLCCGQVPTSARLFINTLPATIRDPLFRGKPLIEFLDKVQVAPDRIVLEITEKLVIENYGLFLESMAYFTELGMRFAVDDVGAGYSGLEVIAKVKPHYLKIDMSLVRNVHESAVNREMVKAIVALGRGVGAEVIAEGIEVEDELAEVKRLGADYGQGYLLARPQMAPEP